MEYSLEEVKKLTKQKLLADPEVFDLYQNIYSEIYDSINNEINDAISYFIPFDNPQYLTYEKVMRVFKLEGYAVTVIDEGKQSIFSISWQN